VPFPEIVTLIEVPSTSTVIGPDEELAPDDALKLAPSPRRTPWTLTPPGPEGPPGLSFPHPATARRATTTATIDGLSFRNILSSSGSELNDPLGAG
jgi:hypothetical protein